MTQSVNGGRFPDAFPLPTDGQSAKQTSRPSNRYEELWDAADEYDELDPTRPDDLLPKDA